MKSLTLLLFLSVLCSSHFSFGADPDQERVYRLFIPGSQGRAGVFFDVSESNCSEMLRMSYIDQHKQACFNFIPQFLYAGQTHDDLVALATKCCKKGNRAESLLEVLLHDKYLLNVLQRTHDYNDTYSRMFSRVVVDQYAHLIDSETELCTLNNPKSLGFKLIVDKKIAPSLRTLAIKKIAEATTSTLKEKFLDYESYFDHLHGTMQQLPWPLQAPLCNVMVHSFPELKYEINVNIQDSTDRLISFNNDGQVSYWDIAGKSWKSFSNILPEKEYEQIYNEQNLEDEDEENLLDIYLKDIYSLASAKNDVLIYCATVSDIFVYDMNGTYKYMFKTGLDVHADCDPEYARITIDNSAQYAAMLMPIKVAGEEKHRIIIYKKNEEGCFQDVYRFFDINVSNSFFNSIYFDSEGKLVCLFSGSNYVSYVIDIDNDDAPVQKVVMSDFERIAFCSARVFLGRLAKKKDFKQMQDLLGNKDVQALVSPIGFDMLKQYALDKFTQELWRYRHLDSNSSSGKESDTSDSLSSEDFCSEEDAVSDDSGSEMSDVSHDDSDVDASDLLFNEEKYLLDLVKEIIQIKHGIVDEGADVDMPQAAISSGSKRKRSGSDKGKEEDLSMMRTE
ncbi:MAG: hypothetical protein WD055_04280 [Candidatus Dependentiae bacterium]